MARALLGLNQTKHPDLLVGFNKADDAGVFRINDDTALVQTLDFFTPVVDDPYSFGQIAAANALSDIYAMGGRPITALNIVAFPVGQLDSDILTEILRGGGDKIEESGAVVVGGHSVKDSELKYGLSVTGLVHPNRIITNSAANPGDQLYLTKPLGIGLITTAIKNDMVDDSLVRIAIAQMAQLNRTAAEIMVECNVNSATDITGYGLLGHAFEMANGSGLTVRIESSMLPMMPKVQELAEAGMIPGGANANREFLDGQVQFDDGIDENLVHVMFDPQTSGGLLIAVDEDRASQFEQLAGERKQFAQRIGQVEPRGSSPLIID